MYLKYLKIHIYNFIKKFFNNNNGTECFLRLNSEADRISEQFELNHWHRYLQVMFELANQVETECI